jgi:ankyrin repeat protein
VRWLLANGADIDAPGVNSCTAIYFASEPAIVEELLRAKPNLAIREGAVCQTPLEHAAYQMAWRLPFPEHKEATEKWRRITEQLRAAGADYTIDAAIYLNDIERVRALLKSDPALVKETRGAQCLPLRLAARQGHVEICKLLLGFHADPDDVQEGLGYPILHDAINHPAVVKLLLQSGANPQVRVTWRGGRTGYCIVGNDATLLHFAAEQGAVDSARLLLERNLRIDGVDNIGQTPLHIAAMIGKAEMVRFLLEHGADMNVKDYSGKTPLDVADKGAIEVLRQFQKKK